MDKIKFQVFGSQDSTDIDVIVFLESLPNIESCKKMCIKYEGYITIIYKQRGIDISSKKIDVNLAVLGDGKLIEVHKGSVDEVNNSLFYTYDYHLPLQQYPQQVIKKCERDLNVKMLRSARIILSLLSKTKYRTIVKQALKKSFKEQIRAINLIDLSTIDDFGKNGPKRDIYKRLVFQIGQTLALDNGFDLYSKSSIKGMYPSITKLMNRDDNITKSDLYSLESFKRKYVKTMSSYYDEIGFESEKTYELIKMSSNIS